MKKQAAKEGIRKEGQTSREETGPQDPVDKAVVETKANKVADKIVRRTPEVTSKIEQVVISKAATRAIVAVTIKAVLKNKAELQTKASKADNNLTLRHSKEVTDQTITQTGNLAGRDKTVIDQTEEVAVNSKNKILVITARKKSNEVLK